MARNFLFAVVSAAAVAFITITTISLPNPVASHFGSGGQANAFMSRGTYLAFMLIFGVGLPLLTTLLIARAPRRFPQSVSLPHRDYWLAPERRQQTYQFFSQHAIWFGCLMMLFFCSLHWLVLRANAQSPPRLAEELFVPVLAAFLIATAAWAVTLVRRFRNVPREQ